MPLETQGKSNAASQLFYNYYARHIQPFLQLYGQVQTVTVNITAQSICLTS